MPSLLLRYIGMYDVVNCRYSRPSQYRRSRDWRKSGGIRKLVVKGVVNYNQEKPYSGLENQRRYWGDDCNSTQDSPN